MILGEFAPRFLKIILFCPNIALPAAPTVSDDGYFDFFK
jgi:hypothetical protein